MPMVTDYVMYVTIQGGATDSTQQKGLVGWVDVRKPNYSTLGLTQGNPRKGHEKRSPIQTDLGVGCWVSLSPKIERFSLTY